MKRFSRIFINTIVYICIAMILLAVSMSGVLNAVIERQFLKTVQDNTRMVFQQLAYQVGYIHETNLAFLNMEFNDSEIRSLVTAREPVEKFDYIQVFNQINKDMSANDMIDSVMLYNGSLDEYYYTDLILQQEDKEIKDLLHADKDGKLVDIYSRTFSGTDERNLLTYIMSSLDARDNSVEYAVVVNVDKDKMLEKIQNSDSTGGYLVLSDSEGNIIINSGTGESDDLNPRISEHLNDGDDYVFIEEVDGERQVINIQGVEGTQCFLISIQPYDTVFSAIAEIRNSIIITVIIILTITLILTVIFAEKALKPLSTLLLRVKAQYGGGTAEKKKEVALLSEVLERQQKQLHTYGDYKERTENILHKMTVKNMLLETGTQNVPGGKIENKATYDVFAKGEDIYIVLFSIAGYHKLNKEDVAERNLIRFVVCNISEEIMQQYGRVEVIPVSGGEVALLLGREEHDPELCRSLLYEVEENVRKVIDVTVSAFAVEIIYDIKSLGAAYKTLKSMSRYTLIYGEGCILFEPEVDLAGRKNLEYPQKLETEIINAVTDGKADKMETAVRSFIDYLRDGRIEGYIASVHKLILSIQTQVSHANQHRLIKVEVDFESVLQESLETDEQVYHLLCGLCREIMEQMPSNVNKKNEAMVEKIREYIDENYAEKDLCSKQIAAHFGMSTGYMGMLFKEISRSSIQEYINQVRLEHAGELVLHTDLLISEIMEKCGFETSSFYRLYKNYFGTSPKEHRMKQRMEEKSGKEI